MAGPPVCSSRASALRGAGGLCDDREPCAGNARCRVRVSGVLAWFRTSVVGPRRGSGLRVQRARASSLPAALTGHRVDDDRVRGRRAACGAVSKTLPDRSARTGPRLGGRSWRRRDREQRAPRLVRDLTCQRAPLHDKDDAAARTRAG